MPYVHNLNPALLTIGGLEIRYYGLVYVIGFILTYFYLDYMRKKNRLDLTKNEVYDLVLYIIVGVFVGSRLFHCLVWEPGYYLRNPLEILYFWKGGMAYHGGLLGVIIAGYAWWKKNKIWKKVSLGKIGDPLSIPAVFALALGRIANFINGELPGRVSDVSWCVYFPRYEGCRHPYQIYVAAKRFAVLAWLVFLSMKEKYKDGFVFWNMITFMGIGRVLLDFYRDDPTFLGLTMGQYWSLAMFLVGGFVLLKYYRNDCKKVFK